MKLAINKTVIGKPKTKEQNGKLTFTYENVDCSLNKLTEYVDRGFAFCAQHDKNHRKSANFLSSDIVAVDIDNGLSLEEALADPFIENNAAIIYTTESHTEEDNRFRIIFQTYDTITSAQDMKDAYTGATIKIGSDKSCIDACRQFYGSSKPNTMVIGRRLSKTVQDELIQLGAESRKAREYKDDQGNRSSRVSVVSNVLVDPDLEVRDSEGISHRLGDLPAKTSIYCVKHIDTKPSAFTVRSRNGVVGFHCSSCKRTYFTSNDVPIYDFNYELRNLNEKDLAASETVKTDEFLTHKYSDIVRLNERYLITLPNKTPLTLVRSPKGTGKTHWLEQVVNQCKSEWLLNDGTSKTKRRKKSVLLIGHRQSLIQSVARRLGLTPYFSLWEVERNGKSYKKQRTNTPTHYYAICADSIPTILDTREHKYDVVLIDEVEQVLGHFTSSTMKDRRLEAFLYFKHYIDRAKEVYVLDADLNYLTVETLWHLLADKTKPVTFITNDYKVKNGTVQLYDNKSHLLGDLTLSINEGKRCFVCSNSKKQVKKLTESLRERFGGEKKIFGITADDSKDPKTLEFINNIKTEILDYDAVIVSPAVGTGVDITFPDDAQLVDSVYGIFEAGVNTHFDIDQQLSRVRNPKEIKVWISPQRFRFSIDPTVIKDEVRNTDSTARQLIGISDDGTPQYNDNDAYFELYANVKAIQRGSKNNLRYHFRKMKEHNGWTIVDVEKNKDHAKGGLEISRRGKELYEADIVRKILGAPLITKDEYQELIKIGKLLQIDATHEFAMRRYEIESFYYTDAVPELIKKDGDGKYRRQIKQYEMYTSSDSELVAADIGEDKSKIHSTDKKTHLAKKRFLRDLFSVAGLSDEENLIITEKIIEGNQLGEFAKFCRQHKEKIARWFEIDIRKDIEKKPAQQLSSFLKMIGITWVKEKPVKRSGEKIYRYTVPEQVIGDLNEIVRRRKDASLTEKWHKTREASKDNRLFDDERDIPEQVKDQLVA